MRHLARLPAAAALALLATGAAARAEKTCFISYEGFEEKVPHLDLDTCPGRQVRPKEAFCRIALTGGTVQVYLFRHVDGQPCLAAVDRYEFNDFVTRFGVNYTKP